MIFSDFGKCWNALASMLAGTDPQLLAQVFSIEDGRVFVDVCDGLLSSSPFVRRTARYILDSFCGHQDVGWDPVLLSQLSHNNVLVLFFVFYLVCCRFKFW